MQWLAQPRDSIARVSFIVFRPPGLRQPAVLAPDRAE